MVRLNRLIVEQACKFQALALPPAAIIVRWRHSAASKHILRDFVHQDHQDLGGRAGSNIRPRVLPQWRLAACGMATCDHFARDGFDVF